MTDIVEGNKEYPGLYCIVFAPDYKTSRFFFVYYVTKDNVTIIARYQTSKTDPDSAVVNSGVILFSIDGKGTGGAHTGDMHFAKDGYLYISFNDGSFYSKTTKFAQDGKSLLGKMLCLKVMVKDSPYYSIPADNPFLNRPDIRNEIWAMGLRNAWRWSFDRRNGNMWIADVGGDKWEEVDVRTPKQPTGVNFGWPCYEGNEVFDTSGCANMKRYVFPLFEYPHINNRSAEVITGGYVYRGPHILHCRVIIYAWIIRGAMPGK
ncbi:MAG: PQQ-dependent sugar dehydrogenase [Panacibacter sp.]